MAAFSGFTSSETFTQIPDSFIRLLGEIEDVAELKVALHAIWRIDHMEGNFRALRESDFAVEMLGLEAREIKRGLKKCLERGTLLKAEHEAEVLYFLNSPRGRLAVDSFTKGKLAGVASTTRERSNLFKLYEENIGPLTPLVADMLHEAERNYQSDWFEEAFGIAVSRNIRNWKYVEAILARWKENGKDERKDQQDIVKDAKRYTDSDFSEFINRS